MSWGLNEIRTRILVSRQNAIEFLKVNFFKLLRLHENRCKIL